MKNTTSGMKNTRRNQKQVIWTKNQINNLEDKTVEGNQAKQQQQKKN